MSFLIPRAKSHKLEAVSSDTRMRARLEILAATMVIASSSTVFAQDDAAEPDSAPVAEMPDEETSQPVALSERAQQLSYEAEEAFIRGDFALSIELLQKAYVEDGNPNMLYNIARVYEAANNKEQALQYYRRFVVAPGVDLEYRREALESSALLEEDLAREERERAARQAQLDVDVPETSTSPSEAITEVRPTTAEVPFPTTSPMRPLGWTLVGVGAATLLGGAGLGVAALGQSSAADEATDIEERRRKGRIARDLASGADAMYISGAVLVVTGLVTAYASPRRAERAPLGKVDLTIRGDEVGAAWSVRF